MCENILVEGLSTNHRLQIALFYFVLFSILSYDCIFFLWFSLTCVFQKLPMVSFLFFFWMFLRGHVYPVFYQISWGKFQHSNLHHCFLLLETNSIWVTLSMVEGELKSQASINLQWLELWKTIRYRLLYYHNSICLRHYLWKHYQLVRLFFCATQVGSMICGTNFLQRRHSKNPGISLIWVYFLSAYVVFYFSCFGSSSGRIVFCKT